MARPWRETLAACQLAACPLVACGQVTDTSAIRSDHPDDGGGGVPSVQLPPGPDPVPEPEPVLPVDDPCSSLEGEIAVVTADAPVQGVARDGSYLYFGTTPECFTDDCIPGSIYRVPLCGSAEADRLVDVADRNQILVDAGDYLYWTGSGSGYVHGRVHKESREAESLDFPECAVVGADEAHAYFACTGAIRRVAHASSELETVVSSIRGAITYRAVIGRGQVFWTDEGATWEDQAVYQADLDGMNPRVLGSFVGQPVGLAATATEVFVASSIPCASRERNCSAGETLQRFPVDGSPPVKIYTSAVRTGSLSEHGNLIVWVVDVVGSTGVDVEYATLGSGEQPRKVGRTRRPASPGGRTPFAVAGGWLYFGSGRQVVAKQFEE